MQETLYIHLANQLESLVEKGVYKPGEKLPSLRVLHQEHGLSIGTVLQAFNHLLDKGVIISKEKSGYFVSRPSANKLPLPESIPASLSARKVHIDQLLARLREDGPGKDFVSFANALPDHRLLPFNSIKRAIQHTSRDISGDYLSMEDRRGNEQLRKEILKRSFHWHRADFEDDVIITNGALESMVLCLKAVTRPGDTVLVQDPCYFGILQSLEYLDLKAVTIPCRSDTGIDVNDLQKACKKFNIKACILVSNFNNPNGVSLSSEKKKQLAEIAHQQQLPIIEDDLYGDLFFGDRRPDAIKTYDQHGWVMYCSSFSKTLVPGFRLGWCMPGRFHYEVARFKSMHNGPVCNFTQKMLYELLHTGVYERHLKKFRIELQKNLLRFTALISAHFPKGTRISQPTGGLVIWVELPKSLHTADLQELAFAKGISFAPGEIFSAKGDYVNYLRLSFCKCWEKKTEKALIRLGEMCHNQL